MVIPAGPWPRLVAVLFATLVAFPAFAQAELVVISRDLEQGEIGAVRVRVRGERPTAPPRIPVSPAGGLNITFQGQGQQLNIVNGRASRSYEYTYGIEALKPGTYTIGPAEVEIGTRKLTTASGMVKVAPRIGAQAEEVQAQAGFDVQEAWVGQVVLYRRSLRSQSRILRDTWTDPPLDGLVPPRDGEPTYSEYPVQNADGVTIVKEEYHPKVVTSPGTRQVPAAVARVTVADPSGRGGRSPFARGPTRTRVIAVPESELVVRELPPAPPGFSGLVGTFTFQANIDRTEAPVGASINQDIVVRGDGTLERFSLPRPASLDGVRLYDGTPATAARVDADGYKSEGRFSRVMVPTRTGRLSIPPLQIITFDPNEGRYITHDIAIPELTIRKGADGESTFESFIEDGTLDTDAVYVEEPYEGVREVRTAGWARTPWLGAWMPWLLGLAAAPLVVLGGLEGVRMAGRVAKRMRRPRTRRTRDISPRQRLGRLPSDPQERLAELDAALRHALARATGTPVESMDREQAIATLADDLAERVRQTTRTLDRARFGGGADEGVETEVRSLVDDLERG